MSPTQQIEARLRAAGAAWAAEPAPDVAVDVLRRIRSGEPARPARRWRPALVGAAMVLAFLVAVPLLVPSVGSAVARYLGVGGIRVEVAPGMPAVAGELALGQRTVLAQARDEVTFTVGLPGLLGEPDEVWLDRRAVPGGQVSLLWRPSARLPQSGPHRVGALLTALSGRLEPGLLAKMVGNPDTTLTSVTVGDGVGWWIGGAPHALTYFDARGQARSDRSRLAGPTLLWQSGETLYRLESGLGMEEALRVARSVG